MFQIVQPNVSSRDPLRSASNNEIHVPSLSHSTTNPLNQNVRKQRKKNYGKITKVCVTHISNPANVLSVVNMRFRRF